MKGALDIHRELLGKDVAHEIVRLPRAVLQAEEIPDALGIDADQVVQVRLYRTDDRMFAVAVPAGRTPQLDALMLAAGSSVVRSATAREVNESTDYAAGLVAPLLLPEAVQLFVDARLGRYDVVYTATGDTGTALGIATADLLMASRARVADFTGVSLADVALDLEV